MDVYQAQVKPLAGTNYKELHKKAFGLYDKIRKKSKRRPYVRSVYFGKQKIFLQLFWNHLHKKNFRDRTRRLKYFPCAIELIQHSRHDPWMKQTLEKPHELLFRFKGKTKEGKIFFVQIKEEIRSQEKWLVSIFPED
ncbi:MAG: hypothetical protein AAB932_02090 [Patescibacteria group bacterium]